MRKLFAVVALVVPLALVGCSKNAEFEDFIKENDAFVKEIKAQADKGGPEAARKAFDAKKDAIKKKFDPIKEARGFQVSEENTKKFTESITTGMTDICSLQIKAMMDEKKSEAYKTLCDDYTKLLTP